VRLPTELELRVRGRQGLTLGVVGCALVVAASACTPVGHAKPLTAAVTVGFVNATNGAQLPYVQGAPGQMDCSTPHPGTGEGCGTVSVSALISGFGGYGGTPKCSTVGYPTCDPGSYLTGEASVSWSLVCSTTHVVTTDSAKLTLAPGFQAQNDHVSGLTRVSDDSAQLGLTADLPLGADIAACSGPSALRSVTVSNVALRLAGGNRYPRSTFMAAGPFTN
jgi:hypothetical protein